MLTNVVSPRTQEQEVHCDQVFRIAGHGVQCRVDSGVGGGCGSGGTGGEPCLKGIGFLFTRSDFPL